MEWKDERSSHALKEMFGIACLIGLAFVSADIVPRDVHLMFSTWITTYEGVCSSVTLH